MTDSPKLLRFRKTLLSSISVHQAGYARVLAYTSAIWCVEFTLSLFFCLLWGFRGRNWSREGRLGDKGSTWTISSQVCTIDLMRDVLPTPWKNQHSTHTVWLRCNTRVTSNQYLQTPRRLSSLSERSAAWHLNTWHNQLRSAVLKRRSIICLVLFA